MKYEYGVEYETNGERPDLPDDVLVHVMFNGSWSDYGNESNRVIHWVWQGSEKFRIVDERYKREEQDMNDWYKNGELPPVGIVVEAMTENKTWIECQVLHHSVNRRGMNVAACVNTRTNRLFWSADFRPLRTETDKLVEQMYDNADGEYDFDTATKPTNQRLLTACRLLHEQGYRKIKHMNEDEFIAAANKYAYKGLYQAGCRFIEQGE